MFSNSHAYDRYMGRWSQQLAPRMVDWVAMNAGSRVLDVGTGTGALAFAFARQQPTVRVTGIDLSPEYVRLAQEQNRWTDQVDFGVGDAMHLSFPDKSFDAVTSLLVMNFVPNAAAALQEMMRVTTSGGTVAASVWDYGGDMEMLRVFWDEAVALDPSIEKKDERHMPLCRKGELAALWKEQGLHQVEEGSIEPPMYFRSFDDYWIPFTLGQGPAGAYVASLSSGKRHQLELRLRHRLLGDRNDGPFELKGRAWVVKGTVR